VVKPGGVFAFFEHGNAPDEGVRRWQRRLEPLQKRVGGGCHLTRDIPALVSDAGWDVVELDSFYGQVPKTFSAFSVGYARNP